MFVLGLLILAAAVVFAVEFVLANHSGVTFRLWNQTWTLDKFWLGVMGAAFLLAVVIALACMRMSLARSRRIRAERRELAAENERLASRAKHTAATPSRKEYPPAPAAAAPQATYPAPPAGPATDADGRQIAYAGAPMQPPVEEGARHHRFFGRHNNR